MLIHPEYEAELLSWRKMAYSDLDVMTQILHRQPVFPACFAFLRGNMDYLLVRKELRPSLPGMAQTLVYGDPVNPCEER